MMRPYTKYQPSDISWLGKVPKHWTKNKFKFLLNEKKKTQNLKLPCGSISFGRVVFKDSERLSEETKAAYQEISSGEFLVNPLNLNYDLKSLRTALADINVIVSSGYIILKSLDVVDKEYLKWLLYLFDLRHMKTLGAGIRQTISYKDIAECAVYTPSDAEQKAIATFLDRAMQRIDSLIEEKQVFIKLLKDKRQALISHAVTKGLNPNAKMQDSGIEWIGQVPRHWKISKIRYLGQCQNGINIGGEFFGHGTPFVSYGDVYNNTSLPEKLQGLVLSTEKDQDNYSVTTGDVLFTRTSETIEEIGFSAVCKSTIEKAVFAGFLIRFRPDEENLEIGFSEYYFRNEKLRAFFAKQMNLVTRASLSQDLLKQMPVLLPPNDEQNEIANYLQTECEKFSEILVETEKTILLLKERKTSLISAAVTGKIDVREAV